MEKEILARLELNEYTTNLYHNYCNLMKFEPLLEDSQEKIFYGNSWEYDTKHCDEDTYVKNYKNIFAQIKYYRIILVVEKTSDKISVKRFEYLINRQVGHKYQTKQTRVDYLTYNLKTNNFYSGFITDYHKKRKYRKQVRTNIFKNTYSSFVSTTIGILKRFDTFNRQFTNEQYTVLSEIFHKFISNIPELSKHNISEFLMDADDMLFYNYLKCKNIKYPNNYRVFLNLPMRPTLKEYRKHKNNLVNAYMSIYDIHGKKIKGILNQVTHINLGFLKFAIKIFGYDFIMAKPKEEIRKIIEYPGLFDYPSETNYFEVVNQMSNTEKTRIYNLLFDVSGNIGYWTLLDHIRFYSIIKQFEDIRWYSETIKDFNDEHLTWSEKVEVINNGEVIREYDGSFIQAVEKPIAYIYETYYPVVLLTNEQYFNESAVQSNCVKTYRDKPCLIISLRKGDNLNTERLTIEYVFTQKHGQIGINRIQTRGKYNTVHEPTWEEAINELDQRIMKYLSNNKFELPKIKIVKKYTTVESDSVFKESELVWVNQELNQDFTWIRQPLLFAD